MKVFYKLRLLLFLIAIILFGLFFTQIRFVTKVAEAVVGTLNMGANTNSTTIISNKTTYQDDMTVGSSVFKSDGSLGLGRTSPGYKLDVNGTSGFNDQIMITATSDPALFFNSGPANGTTWIYGQSDVPRLRIQRDGTVTTNTVLLKNGNVNTQTTTVSLSGSGNSYFNAGSVGIGTTGPGAMLHVYNGNSIITNTNGTTNMLTLQNVSNTDQLMTIGMGGNGGGGGASGRVMGQYGLEVGSVYNHAAYYLSLSTAATERMRIDNAGNVGIGTTGPLGKLDVRGTTYFNNGNIDGAYGDQIFFGAGAAGYPSTYLHKIKTSHSSGLGSSLMTFSLDTGASSYADVMTLQGTGNVGIGTTSPGYQLTLGGTGSNFAVANTSTWLAKNASGTYESWMWPRWNDNIMYTNFGSAGWNIRNNSSTSVMFMQNGGNVGIGTTGPTEKLTIYGTDNSAPGIMSLESNRQDAGGVEVGRISGKNAGVESSRISLYRSGGSNNGFLAFSTKTLNDSSAPLERVRINEVGNVGIGTTGPGYKLDVSGDIRATGIVRANANGAAYFCGGDDACLYDVNVANTVGIYGAQNSAVGGINLGSSGSRIYGDGTWNYSTTAYGTISFGPANSSWAHIYSDKNFYFNQNLYVNGNIIPTVASSNTWTGLNYFQSNLGPTSGSLANPPLMAYSTGGNSAFMSFHRGGYYAVNMGLDSDNVLRIGGWSAAANRWQLDMSGNETIAGGLNAGGNGTYNTFNTWTNLPGYHGFYSSNYNGSHFYVNNGSYGAWRIAGNRNGWYGLEFDTAAGNTTLMMGTTGQGWGSQMTGMHNNSYGWLWRWDHGTLAVGTVPWANVSKPGNIMYWDTWLASTYWGSNGDIYLPWLGAWLSQRMFGGMYNVGEACNRGNPYTGGCSCPAGFYAVYMGNTVCGGGCALYYCSR